MNLFALMSRALSPIAKSSRMACPLATPGRLMAMLVIGLLGLSSVEAQAQTTSTTTGSTTTTTLSAALNLSSGWNLVGNSSSGSLNVATFFNDDAKFSTVWKWIAGAARWAFYAPSLVDKALTDYVASKGYDVLTTINAGEGFWVNAKQSGSVTLPAGTAFTAAQLRSTMITGWNLVSVGETATPKQFSDAQISALTTLWAWDATTSAWYFYAPSLEASGALAGYIVSKSYLDFTARGKTLESGVGFWANMSAVANTASTSTSLSGTTTTSTSATTSSSSTTSTSTSVASTTTTTLAKDLVFTADTGYRVTVGGAGARQPRAGQDSTGTTTYLYYETDAGAKVSTSTDGVTFSTGSVATDYRYHDRFLKMPDGRWRTFMPAMPPDSSSIISMSSADGLNPSIDTGSRYTGVAADNAKFGIVEVYPDPGSNANQYTMLYIGDITGLNNIRRAVSTDGGNTFTFDRDNVLGDANDTSCGFPNCKGVDQVSVTVAGGLRRLFVMVNGQVIDSYISDSNWNYFTKEPGHRVTTATFTSAGLTCYSLHDPTVVKLADGRYRMYVACRTSDVGPSATTSDSGSIVSAISSP